MFDLNILTKVAKFEELLQKIVHNQEKIEKRLGVMENKILRLGKGCQKAFHQTKIVVQKLAENQEKLNEDLSEYGGTICESTFF